MYLTKMKLLLFAGYIGENIKSNPLPMRLQLVQSQLSSLDLQGQEP